MQSSPLLSAVHQASLAFLRPMSANATSAHELEAAIGALMSTVQRAAEEIASAWNARNDRVWRRLPVELRAQCFQHLALDDKIALTHTSKLWRRNALDIPALWSTIQCTDSSPRQAERVQTLLQRSGNASLSLTVAPCTTRNKELLSHLRQHMHRVKSLLVNGSGDATTLMDALLPRAQAPLPRMETLDFDDMTCWRSVPKDLCRLLPRLRSLHIKGDFPGIFDAMPHLRSLRIVSSETSDNRHMFTHCPNLERLEIGGQICSSMLPSSRPPASLRNVALVNDVYGGPGVLDPTPFFAPWAGHTALESLRIFGARELASSVALFTSVCAGPWLMRIRGARLNGWPNVFMAPVGGHKPAFAIALATTDVGTAADALLACVPHLDRLELLELPVCMFERICRSNVALRAVTSLRISTEHHRSGIEADNTRALTTDWTSVPRTRVLRVPRLQNVSLLTDDCNLSEAVAFAGTLRRTIKFDAARLDRVVFSGAFWRGLTDLAPGLQRLVDREVAKEVGYLRSLDFVRIVP